MKALNQVINTKSAGARWQWRVLRARRFDVIHATRSTRCNGMLVRRIAGGTESGNRKGQRKGQRKEHEGKEAEAGKSRTKKRGIQKRGRKKSSLSWIFFYNLLAERTGLEPATPGVTGRYSNQLNYRSTSFHQFVRLVDSSNSQRFWQPPMFWRPQGDSNPCTHRERVMS